MIRAVLFDMDETLVDSAPCHHEASRRAFATFGLDYDEGFRRTGSFIGMRPQEMMERRRNALGADEQSAPIAQILQQRDEHYERLVSQLVVLLPGAREALEAVQNAGLVAGVVSSATRRTMAAIFEHFSLMSLIAVMVSGQDVENGKPHPESYELGLRRVQEIRSVQRSECLVVEDSERGFQAARAAQLPVCLVPFEPQPESLNPEFRLESLIEFPALLARLTGGA